MMLKYAEVYLGMKFRVGTGSGGYQGGPMYFLQLVFKTMKVPYLVCFLLCIYGVEVYQFSVVTESISTNFNFDKLTVTLVLLALVLYAGIGGVKRVGAISAWIIPLFVTLYVGMGGWVILQHFAEIPALFLLVFKSAFTGHAALGGFVGSTIMITVSHGIRRASYSGDLGVGYASVIHSESSIEKPEKQAALVYFDLFLDSFIICTTTLLLIMVTGVWNSGIDTPLLVQTALSGYFPYMHFFMPLFLFLLGYSTINAYFVVGLKCAEFMLGKNGKVLYFGYAAITLFVFSFQDLQAALTVMSLTNVLLLLINSYGIFKLRKEINFELVPKKFPATVSSEVVPSTSE
jgi:AGCS family alanine or glycine:cation symporter